MTNRSPQTINAAMTRAPIAERPDVSRTPLGTVLMEMTGDQAVILAKALAHYDVLTTMPAARIAGDLFVSAEKPTAPALTVTPGFRREVWHHTLIDLLVESTQLRGRVAEVVDVDRALVHPSNLTVIPPRRSTP